MHAFDELCAAINSRQWTLTTKRATVRYVGASRQKLDTLMAHTCLTEVQFNDWRAELQGRNGSA